MTFLMDQALRRYEDPRRGLQGDCLKLRQTILLSMEADVPATKLSSS
jgi:hypothetical protein